MGSSNLALSLIPCMNFSRPELTQPKSAKIELEPEVFMTVGLYPKPKHYADQGEAIGEALSTYVKGMRQHQIGNSQAWYYPQDKVIVLWEWTPSPIVCKGQ